MPRRTRSFLWQLQTFAELARDARRLAIGVGDLFGGVRSEAANEAAFFVARVLQAHAPKPLQVRDSL